ncbi:hypothetical protein ACNJFH_21295, partial [Mycobacterium tuberculosis]
HVLRAVRRMRVTPLLLWALEGWHFHILGGDGPAEFQPWLRRWFSKIVGSLILFAWMGEGLVLS